MNKLAPRCLVAMVTLLPAYLLANPIPLPTPASMPLEEMRISIDNGGHVVFEGRFTFDAIPATVDAMRFPLPPVNASNLQLKQDGVPQPWALTTDTYPTVLPEFAALAMFEWQGPFPAAGAVFTVDYEHDLFQRGSDWVLFYSLGTGKAFPTYDKVTTAHFEIDLPPAATLKSIALDSTPIDPRHYRLSGARPDLTLTSDFGPFSRDLILLMSLPEPATILLTGVAMLVLAATSRRRPGRQLDVLSDHR